MFRTKPFVAEKVWGYERWLVSTHSAGVARIEGEDEAIETRTGAYPLLIKVIQADQTLSVQVHPDDAYAKEHENSAGKSECWYILDAAPDSAIVYGLNGRYSREELEKAINEHRLEPCLRSVPVAKGDFVFIPAGTVHAIQGGLRLLEVQQTSDVTYRLYDWGRPREVHVQKGLDVIKQEDTPLEPERPFSGRFVCPYFSLARYDLSISSTCLFISPFDLRGRADIDIDFKTPATKRKWYSFFVLSGSGLLISSDGSKITVKHEDCVMVHIDERLSIIPDEGAVLSVMAIG